MNSNAVKRTLPSTNEPEQAARILIIEDDPELSNLVAGLLQRNGYKVRQCFDGQSGLQAALTESYSLILLDVLMPEMDGFEVLNKLRRRSETPVIMVTAKGAEADRISGFKTGADDYLPKPFNVEELLLRIEAVIKRARASLSRTLIQPTSELAADGLCIDVKMQSVYINGEPLALTTMEMRLLTELVENQYQVLSKPYLYQELMGRPYSRDERSLDVHVSKLRRKLKAMGYSARQIHTIHGQGYCFK